MIIIHDGRLPERYVRKLKEKFPSAVLFPFKGPDLTGVQKVYGSISCHPDIYLFQLDGKTLIHAPCLSETQLRYLKEAGVELIKGEGDPGSSYPHTARYNAVRIGDTVFHNLSYTDPVILKTACEKGLKLVNVKQGYTRCSVLALSGRAVITADKGIAETVGSEGIDVLLLHAGPVLLPGEKYGFIGGTGGMTPEGTVVLLGGVGAHAEASEIKLFFEAHTAGYIDMAGMPLYDAGGLIIMNVGPVPRTGR